MLKAGELIAVVGYGEMQGQKDAAKVLSLGTEQAVLQFRDGGKSFDVTFRLADGRAINATPEQSGGFEIPKEVLAQLKNGKAPEETAPESGKPDAAVVTTGRPKIKKAKRKVKPEVKPQATPAKVAGKKDGTNMATATKEKNAPETTAKARVKKVTVTEPEKNGAKNGAKNGKTAPEAVPEVKKARTRTAKAPEPTPEKVTRRKAEPKENSESAEELTPMELEGIGRKQRREDGPDFMEIKIAPLMYRQICHQEIKPYPNGRGGQHRAGFSAFKKAFDAAAERSYVYIGVTKLAAEYLLNTVFVNGFSGGWRGPLQGGFFRGARRTAQDLGKHFKIAVPAELKAGTNMEAKPPRAGKTAPTPAPEPEKTTRKRTAKVEPEPEKPKAKKTRTASKPEPAPEPKKAKAKSKK